MDGKLEYTLHVVSGLEKAETAAKAYRCKLDVPVAGELGLGLN